MTVRKNISVTDLQYAIAEGDFSKEIIRSAPFVAVILTQSWCPQWVFMRSWLGKLSKEVGDMELAVYEAEYDRLPIFNEFRNFKEATFNNWEVPYVRYYKEGELIGESNFVSVMSFLDFFKNAS